MPDFHTVFNGRSKVFLAVVHAQDNQQATLNAQIAYTNGADGIWLIGHRMDAAELNKCYDLVRVTLPPLWIGLNYLEVFSSEQALELLPGDANGIWFDDAGYNENSERPEKEVRELRNRHKALAPHVLLFGGIAHKGNAPIKDLKQAVQMSSPLLDVVVTTGAGTGIAADPQKIKDMRHWQRDVPLALASGVTPKNASEYLPHVDCIMVATGVSKTFHLLDAPKVAALSKIVRSY